MPASNLAYLKKISNKYYEMEDDFERIESEYKRFMSSNCNGYIFDILYSISDFFDTYETFVIEANSVYRSNTFTTEKSKTKYQGIASDSKQMIDESIDMYRELKSLQELGGGFSHGEETKINTFRIDSLI